MKRLLLTGATGFIGRHCLPLLVAGGYEVHAVTSRSSAGLLSDVYWHQADLLDPAQTATVVARVKPTYLLHFAWYASSGRYWTSQENLRWVQASLDLLKEFARHGGHRVVMAGSCAEYDWRYGHCSEAVTPLAPASLYGASKHSLQLMLTAYSQHAEPSSAWGRVFFLFGPHEHPDRLVAYVIRCLLDGKPARCSRGDQIRDFLHVEDVAEAFVALLESAASGPVNIASGKPVALREVISAIAETLDRPDLIQLGALPDRENDPPVLIADVRRLRDEVGWQPRYDLEQGILKTIEWWKTHRGIGVT